MKELERPVENQLRTGLNHNQSQDCKRPSKDRTEPVHVGSVQSFVVFQIWKTGLGLGPCLLGSKDQTRPDFQTLMNPPPQNNGNNHHPNHHDHHYCASGLGISTDNVLEKVTQFYVNPYILLDTFSQIK